MSHDFLFLACNTTTSDPIDKRRPQADSAHEIGPKTTLQGVLIVVESGGTVGKTKAGRNFSPLEIGNVFTPTSTTSAPMGKWMLQAHLAHQIGLQPILNAVLILVESGGTGEE